eukprot:CAMPEP_0114625222 /NCGR_PEP_ID=MMETSP0168-20121206/11161_1 /TAXON_ID=95228 ORGANISM="Vannella sp., Strain DIVA3 517/6/12" /NCGR_SAMPLE_ID=MMETSP0168 /ASSEMBLY_ACC=CAM_ASM_000044 /LENGTH=234 /DNA_ID=CAMNT_0001836501 /DNA_START=121 /DNA_END=825 /DNA_ORIENTATION=+
MTPAEAVRLARNYNQMLGDPNIVSGMPKSAFLLNPALASRVGETPHQAALRENAVKPDDERMPTSLPEYKAWKEAKGEEVSEEVAELASREEQPFSRRARLPRSLTRAATPPSVRVFYDVDDEIAERNTAELEAYAAKNTQPRKANAKAVSPCEVELVQMYQANAHERRNFALQLQECVLEKQCHSQLSAFNVCKKNSGDDAGEACSKYVDSLFDCAAEQAEFFHVRHVLANSK